MIAPTVQGYLVDLDALTPAEMTQAYRDAIAVTDAIVDMPRDPFLLGDLRAKLDWEIPRFARACAVLQSEGVPLGLKPVAP